ncbi:endonuclease/exonuclease/phosphatase family protein [Paracoccus stylophorae]|uniref:Endonuclease/exonuclease/phosphatase family protein n=1 Tax=Paracoccus stylophorae TaxID=659350 RepID=A0ABY7SZF6_9RHOB|nr:endonuclease/exonuclease/phosphatase family protein [Paracoccus stylophorae]WCR12190.1 endonuclease/exonuclease/phosphatase family protein [Paracoccus stylophorae]
MTVLRIASYNLHKCRGLTGPHAPERNLAVIAALKPDIIALQEVDFRYGARPEALPRALIARTTGLVPADITGRTGANSLGWHGQTILMRPDLADEAVVRRLPLPGIEPRGALVLRFPTLTVIGVHLGLARSSRRAQLARITAQASRIADDNIVLLGDFNEWRDDRGLESLAGFRVIAPGPSYPAPMPRFRLDRIAMSQHLTLRRHGVFTGAGAREASDHLPIWAEIVVP